MFENTFDSPRKKIVSIALVLLMVSSVGAIVVFPVSAAGGTTVSLSPSNQQVSSGNTTSYEVVVEDTNNGIGTTNANVTLDNPSVGTIENVSIAGTPANKNITITDNGSVASFNAIYFGNALADKPNGVTIATVTVKGTSSGSSDLSLGVSEISDSGGNVYTITGTSGASVTVVGETTPTSTQTSTTTTPTQTQTETQTTTVTQTRTATQTQTGTPTPETTTGTAATPTATQIPTTMATSTTTATSTTIATPTTTGTTTTTETQTATTATPTSNETATQTTTTPTATGTNNMSSGGGGAATNNNQRVNASAVTTSLAGSGLSDEQVTGISSALSGSSLSNTHVTAITDALSGNSLTDQQRRTVANTVTRGDLTDKQLTELADALNDGTLTSQERANLGFLTGATTGNETAYYQVDFVAGGPIKNLRGPNGTYTNDQLIRFAHGSTNQPVMRRSDGEFTTNQSLGDRVESHNITVANGTATTTVTVANDSNPVTLTLASYRKIGPGWSPQTEAQQEFVDADTQTFGPGTHTLTVDLPDTETTDGNHSSTNG